MRPHPGSSRGSDTGYGSETKPPHLPGGSWEELLQPLQLQEPRSAEEPPKTPTPAEKKTAATAVWWALALGRAGVISSVEKNCYKNCLKRF